jgi:putative membrane protein
MKYFFTRFLQGFLMGFSDIVPGVSSTVLALLFGFYEDLLTLYFGITEFVRVGVKKVRGRTVDQDDRESLWCFDWKFLVALVIGYGVAVVSVSSVLSGLLDRYSGYVYAVFLGVMIVSIGEIFRRVDTWTWLLRGVFMVGLVVSLVPILVEGRILGLDFTGWALFPVGLLASVGGVVPGFSGGFILLFFGVYDEVLRFFGGEFVLNWDLVLLALGAIVGYGLFARYVKRVYESYQQTFLVAIGGLITGSLWVLWPFVRDAQEGVVRVLPWAMSVGQSVGIVLSLMLSVLVMLGVRRFALRGKK